LSAESWTFEVGILLKIIRDKASFGMKINWFNNIFFEEKQQQNTSPYKYSAHRLMVFNYVADARELKLRHLIFLSPPLVKMNIFPHFICC